MRAASHGEIKCVKGEIHNVLTVMRLNSRWASAARFQAEVPLRSESPLLRGLRALHDQLTHQGQRCIGEVDTVRFLQPFVDVVTSPDTSAPITGAALSSLHKFLLYGFVTPASIRAREGINLIAQGAVMLPPPTLLPAARRSISLYFIL